MTPETFVEALAAIRLPNVFNPYADICGVFDREDAPETRRRNLLNFLRAAESLRIDTLWMGRDLGHRGGRRTGLALTDERHLAMIPKVYGGAVAERATKGQAVAERTAAEIWLIICGLRNPPFLWNVFPFHPYEAGSQFSNRRFSAKELSVVHEINHALITWLGIRRIVAIGQDAARYSTALGTKLMSVRHPSYGGVNEFRDGIKALYPTLRRRRAAEQIPML